MAGAGRYNRISRASTCYLAVFLLNIALVYQYINIIYIISGTGSLPHRQRGRAAAQLRLAPAGVGGQARRTRPSLPRHIALYIPLSFIHIAYHSFTLCPAPGACWRRWAGVPTSHCHSIRCSSTLFHSYARRLLPSVAGTRGHARRPEHDPRCSVVPRCSCRTASQQCTIFNAVPCRSAAVALHHGAPYGVVPHATPATCDTVKDARVSRAACDARVHATPEGTQATPECPRLRP